MKNLIVTLLKLTVVAGIFYYLISRDRMDMGMLLQLWTSWFALVMVLVFFVWILPLSALRVWLILRSYDIRIPVVRMFMINWIGGFFNTCLPGGVSGDVVKGYYIVQEDRKKEITNVIVTLVIDRIIGVSSLIILSFLTLLVYDRLVGENVLPGPLVYMVIGLFTGVVVFYGILLFPFQEGKDPLVRFISILPGKDTLLRIYRAFKHFQQHKGVLLYSIIISIGVHLSFVAMLVEIARFMGKSVAVADQLFIMPLGFITTVIPLAPGGIGIGHVAFDSLYRMLGVSGGADIFNLFVTVHLAIFFLGGIPYLLMRNKPESVME